MFIIERHPTVVKKEEHTSHSNNEYLAHELNKITNYEYPIK